MQLQPDEVDSITIIEHLREKLSMLHFPSLQCGLCNWVDHEDEFVECHPGSEFWVCNDCVAQAKEQKLSLCTDDCVPKKSSQDKTSDKKT